jgi:hypothetical protein
VNIIAASDLGGSFSFLQEMYMHLHTRIDYWKSKLNKRQMRMLVSFKKSPVLDNMIELAMTFQCITSDAFQKFNKFKRAKSEIAYPMQKVLEYMGTPILLIRSVFQYCTKIG